jgi:hypothetical protein
VDTWIMASTATAMMTMIPMASPTVAEGRGGSLSTQWRLTWFSPLLSDVVSG